VEYCLLRVFGAIACALLSVAGSSVAEETGEPVRILWAGSSSMYFHNAPKTLVEWLTSRAELPARSEIVGRSGTGIHVYLRPDFRAEYGLDSGQSILEKIADERFDYVVLQVSAEFINGPEGDEHDKSLDVYCRAVRAAGGAPVIYEMGWGRGEDAVVGRRKIFAAAVRNGIRHFAPCATTWQRARKERPDLNLQDPPDRTHPGTLGVYLNLCCFYAAITGKPPKEMPANLRIWRHLSDEEKAALRTEVETMPLDEYDRQLAGWMKRRVAGSKEVDVPAAAARYLERVAWEEYVAARKRLDTAITSGEKSCKTEEP
jgi:hypothetical protein